MTNVSVCTNDGRPAVPVKQVSSLKSVAEKVVNYFRDNKISSFDINDVVDTLNIPKRRLYDVLNIMSPLGYVSKSGRGRYTWTDTTPLNINITESREVHSEKFHVKDLSFSLLKYIIQNKVPTIQLGSISSSIFGGDKSHARRIYDIIAVFEVLKLIERRPKSSEFTILPQLKTCFTEESRKEDKPENVTSENKNIKSLLNDVNGNKTIRKQNLLSSHSPPRVFIDGKPCVRSQVSIKSNFQANKCVNICVSVSETM